MSERSRLSEAGLEIIEQRAAAASPAPWFAWFGPGHGGDDFIQVGGERDEPDMYVMRDGKTADSADLDFIATARQDIPRLVAEIRRLRRAQE